ncbi:MAG: site-specific DNA-methyltransferase [Kiritimatiellaeota bacterium]|nr:site-specific DNA-methyltransferase [Kiritimatiellota bacterium]
MIELLHTDCMDYMRGLHDKAFGLAIVDPPYGIGGNSTRAGKFSRGAGKLKGRAIQRYSTSWDVAPTAEYFSELFRVSENQIIWGGNYFSLPRARCIICWDKVQPWKNFSQCEMAWTSFNRPAKLFRLDNRTGGKIHPTQKPVNLYKWILDNFAEPGSRILDTHLGSGSIALACHETGFDLVGCEIDKAYYDGARERLANFRRQQAFGLGKQEKRG